MLDRRAGARVGRAGAGRSKIDGCRTSSAPATDAPP